jgi:hypothetical protein
MHLNPDVTKFLDDLNHPYRPEIEALRLTILQANGSLLETIKWNAPNYSVDTEDRITMRIHPPKQVQLIFHRGAKVKEQPKDKLLQEDSGLLEWKATDRAIATFTDMASIAASQQVLVKLVQDWVKITS